MWVRVRSSDGHRFSIPVPLSIAGSRLAWLIVAKINGPEVASYAPFAREMVRELRRYVRKNGPFCLVDVQENEGDSVKITV